jgi:REP element-mobilizing transposase RayT
MAGVKPRPILPGATYLVTRRCTQRQFLLVPKRRTTQIFHYCLAYAAQRTGVEVHAVIVMSNHYHLVVTDPRGVLPLFVECLNKLVAKCVNASLGRWENFWASEPASYVQLLDVDAVIDKLAYLLANPVDAALVENGYEWPGLRLGRPGSYPTGRPDIFFREEGAMPMSLRLELTPPPGLAGRQAQKRIKEAVAERECDARARVRREGRSFLGARAILRQNPFDSPRTIEPRRQLSPRIASRNKWLRIETLTGCAAFVRDHARALARWFEGKRTAVFPVGTYLMRIRHGVRCAET